VRPQGRHLGADYHHWLFPAKPLGCYRDGGAILTDDPDLVATLKSLRVHEQGTDKYDNVRIGMNSRLDTIQTAILMCKLDIFAGEIEARQTVAARYTEALANSFVTATVPIAAVSVRAQYEIRILGGRRGRSDAQPGRRTTAIYYCTSRPPTAISRRLTRWWYRSASRKSSKPDYAPLTGQRDPREDCLSFG
jgi:DegT/DnrJ/EryC1/StrS aminotransferase family